MRLHGKGKAVFQKVRCFDSCERVARTSQHILARLLVNSKSRDEFEPTTQLRLVCAFKTDFYACLDGWVDREFQEACSFRYREIVAAYVQRISKSILGVWPESCEATGVRNRV
jgi:hypothetical protein